MYRSRCIRTFLARLLGGMALTAWAAACIARPQPGNLRLFVPATVSPQARVLLRKLEPLAVRAMANFPKLRTMADFDRLYAETTPPAQKHAEAVVKALDATTRYFRLDGVGVLETIPSHYTDDGTVLIRVHGGGWILGSARSSADLDAMMAAATGRRVLSVDYTVAPHAHWRRITDQVIAVYKAVLAMGYPPSSVGIYGDSAGGNIAAGSVLKLRNEGIPMPGALVLMSPCTDLHLDGDTETTLRDSDPVLAIGPVREAASAYAAPANWSNPYVSPVFGDFSKGFPPVLIQVGTREMLLSDSVRLYQAVNTAGGVAILDVFEGMPHVFQGLLPGTPEQKVAFTDIRHFWDRYLTSRTARPVHWPYTSSRK